MREKNQLMCLRNGVVITAIDGNLFTKALKKSEI